LRLHAKNATNYIYFQLDDNVNFTSPLESGAISTGASNSATWQPSQALLNEKTYFWRASIDSLNWFPTISFDIKLDIHAYPVPFKISEGHSAITFTNLPEQSRITIATVSGKIVKESDEIKTGGDWVWDVKNSKGKELASGVYLYFIDFPSGSANGKLMVIR